MFLGIYEFTFSICRYSVKITKVAKVNMATTRKTAKAVLAT